MSTGSGTSKSCYFCLKPGHKHRNCGAYKAHKNRQFDDNAQASGNQGRNENEGRTKPKSRCIKASKNPSIGANFVGLEAGLFIDMEVCGFAAKLLVDTGATFSLISTTLMKRIPEKARPVLDRASRNVLDAGGNCPQLIGKGTFPAKIKAFSCHLDGVVAELSTDGVIGLDFLGKNQCTVDIAQRTMAINGVAYSLTKEGSYGYWCYKMVAQDTVTIPTNQEVLIKRRVCAPEDEGIALTHGLVEPGEKLMATGTLVGRTLVTADRVVPIRILNFSPECRTIYSGTHLADLSVLSRQKKKAKATSALLEKLEDLLR